MVRKTIHIELSDEYKARAMELMSSTIDNVAKKYNFELTNKEKKKIINLSLDQVNLNTTSKAREKTMWVFDAECSLPVVVEFENKYKDLNPKTGGVTQGLSFKMKPNLSWAYNKNNSNEGGLLYEKFVEENLKLLMEDFETAAFYGAFSYVSEDDVNE